MAPRQEVQVAKSPAEFFAENQAIAGFDNLGKSLYTTIRELVENALDACESVGVLPSVAVKVEEMSQQQFNVVRGLSSPSKEDKETQKDTDSSTKKNRNSTNNNETNDGNGSSNKKDGKKRAKRELESYFRVIVRDNGCGMDHQAIPDLLGRVLSGSKYGVRQTRGKFGLGAKMALIWSKKSTGIPIRVKTSHMLVKDEPGTNVSNCVLDIDIYKNRPRVMEHTKVINKEKWIGTEFEVLIAGNWSTYKSRIVQYMQQLAIITPYAQLELTYHNQTDPKKNMTARYDRRSNQMPPPAKEVKHHPSSVNNLLVQQLLDRTKCKTLAKFLDTDLSSISPTLAKQLIAELGTGFSVNMAPSDVTDRQVTRMVQLLRSVELKPPDGSCLSPLGEYNLSLGIKKVLEPELVATARDKPSSYDGHPFIVEAAVSLGGKDVKEGITVIRFANRIPLLFEGGADVASRVAMKKIKWSYYKIDHKRDKIGVFVSIVSTKVPFKGTGKEYIGDDITAIQVSVKRALQTCCQELRTHVQKKHALKDVRERKSKLVKYVPDVARSLFGVLDGIRKRRLDGGSVQEAKRPRLDNESADRIMESLANGELKEETFQSHLLDAIEAQSETVPEDGTPHRGSNSAGDQTGERVVLSLAPPQNLDQSQHDIHHPLFCFRPANPPLGGC